MDGSKESSTLLLEFEKLSLENNKLKESLHLVEEQFKEEISLHKNVVSGLQSEQEEILSELAKKEEEELRHRRMLNELGEHAELLQTEKVLLENALKLFEEDTIKKKAAYDEGLVKIQQLTQVVKENQEEINKFISEKQALLLKSLL